MDQRRLLQRVSNKDPLRGEQPDVAQFPRPFRQLGVGAFPPAPPDRPLPALRGALGQSAEGMGAGDLFRSLPIRSQLRYQGVQMISQRTTSSTASATINGHTGRGRRADGRNSAQRSAAGCGGRCAGSEDHALHVQKASAWRRSPVIRGGGDPDAVAKFHTYSLDKQLLIMPQATDGIRTRIILRTPRTRSGGLNATVERVNRRRALLRMS
jgi:hypothetical protein